MIALVIVPPPRAGRPTLAARSTADPARAYHQAGSDLFARAGHVATLTPLMSRILLILAGHRACFVSRYELWDLVYADDPTGGPDTDSIDVTRSNNRFNLDALGIRLACRYSRGLEILLVEPNTQNPTPKGLGLGGNRQPRVTYPWVDRAADLRRSGMTWESVGKAVSAGVHHITVQKVVLRAHPDTGRLGRAVPPPVCRDPARYCDPAEMVTDRARLRREMRRRAARTAATASA